MYIDAMFRLGAALPASAAEPLAVPQLKIPPIQALKGTFFDPALDFRDPEGASFTEEILGIIAPFKRTKNKPRALDAENHRTIVRKILANAYRCLSYRQPSRVAYFRKADAYDRSYPWLSGRSMGRTVDLLTDAGLLKCAIGERGAAASTYDITNELYERAIAHGISEHSLTYRLPAEQLVRLRTSAPERRQLTFEPTDDTRTWTALLEAYNGFYGKHDVALALTAEEEIEWAKRWTDKLRGSGASLYRPERFQTDLYRQFNNGSFDEGGRMYGGWWIYAPKAFRKRITINTRPTVELDYAGCAIRMLYQDRGIDYREDPYHLDLIADHEEAKGLPPEHFREAIKRIVQALINDRSGKRPERIKLPDSLTFYPAFTRAEVRQMIEEKHAPIADAFGTGAGLRLQRQDSDIALSVITDLMEEGILALPIHDSFIVEETNADCLYNQMVRNYERYMGFSPIIK